MRTILLVAAMIVADYRGREVFVLPECAAGLQIQDHQELTDAQFSDVLACQIGVVETKMRAGEGGE
jgi:hypothetical protein